ncbi:MAG TPA: TRAP transporter substrate-binding protein [Steroidobacteraceae bacterium]|nr:TRAP transporter substrate-binding protein [Steroidobacteraceae bacterium]
MLDRRHFMLGAMPLLLGAAREPATVLTAADAHVDGYPTVEAVRWIGKRLAEETGGRLGLRMYHSGQLGRENDTVDLVRHDVIDLTRVNFAPLNNAFPATRVAALPFVFDSTAHMRRAMDGAPGREILQRFGARDLVGLCIYDSGTRCFYNVRRPVHEPADLHGLKVRVPPSDIFLDFCRVLGANPTPLPFGEVYSALQTHLIDGAENNIRSFHSTRQFEVARYWSETAHSYSPEALLISRARLDRLEPRDRHLLTDIATASVPYMRQLWDEAEAKSRAAVIADGVRINAVDTAAFHAAAAPFVQTWLRNPEEQALHRAIRSLA